MASMGKLGRKILASWLCVTGIGCGGRTSMDSLSNGMAADVTNRDPTHSAGSGGTLGSTGTLTVGGSTRGSAGSSIGGVAGGNTASVAGAAGAGIADGLAGAAGRATCPFIIDDMEDGTGRIRDCDNRKGVWYAFNKTSDAQASQWPAPTTPSVPIATSEIPGGRGNSHRAMHSNGSSPNSDWYAGIGLDVAFDGRNYGTYDASTFDGVTFWTRGYARGMLELRIGSAGTTLPIYGGTCKSEYCAPNGATIDVRDAWRQRWIPFTGLRGGEVTFDPKVVTNIQFYCPWGCSDFDFWVDDVAFYSGPPSCCASPKTSCQGSISLENTVLGRALSRSSLESCDVCAQTSLAIIASDSETWPSDWRGLGCYTNLSVLSVDHVAVADASIVSQLELLDELSLVGTGLEDVRSLSSLADLRRLKLKSNRIAKSSALTGIRGLTSLDLEGNLLSEIELLAEMRNLEALDVSNNRIQSVGALRQLTRLETLDLSNNAIVDISPLAGLTQLTTLDLSNNQISDLSPLANLKQLTTLKLSNNRVVDIKPLATLDALNVLELDHNAVVELAPLTRLVRLQRLGLTDNAISDVKALGGMTSITDLDLSGNRISDVTGLYVGLTNLKLGSNRLSDLASLASLTRLIALDVSVNDVSDLTPLGSLPVLASLDVDENRIEDLAPLATAPALHSLSANGNRISELTPLVGVKSFDVIYIGRGWIAGALSVSKNPIDCVEQASNLASFKSRGVVLTSDCAL